MIITNSNQLRDHLYEFMQEKMCFRKLNMLKKIKISARFRPIFNFELKGIIRAENPSAQALVQASSARTHLLVRVKEILKKMEIKCRGGYKKA